MTRMAGTALAPWPRSGSQRSRSHPDALLLTHAEEPVEPHGVSIRPHDRPLHRPERAVIFGQDTPGSHMHLVAYGREETHVHAAVAILDMPDTVHAVRTFEANCRQAFHRRADPKRILV